jgi:hypothetical protein
MSKTQLVLREMWENEKHKGDMFINATQTVTFFAAKDLVVQLDANVLFLIKVTYLSRLCII